MCASRDAIEQWHSETRRCGRRSDEPIDPLEEEEEAEYAGEDSERHGQERSLMIRDRATIIGAQKAICCCSSPWGGLPKAKGLHIGTSGHKPCRVDLTWHPIARSQETQNFGLGGHLAYRAGNTASTTQAIHTQKRKAELESKNRL